MGELVRPLLKRTSPSHQDSLPQHDPTTLDTKYQDLSPEEQRTDDGDESLDGFFLTALKNSKDRLFMLKLDHDLEDFINDESRQSMDFPPLNSYYRLIVHRVAQYFKLTHVVDSTCGVITLYKTLQSKIFNDLIETEEPSAPPPKLMIMRRKQSETPSEHQTQTTSEKDQSGVPGKSPETQSKTPTVTRTSADSTPSNRAMTLEEREEAYKKARAEIFNGEEPPEEDNDELDAQYAEAFSNPSQPIKIRPPKNPYNNINYWNVPGLNAPAAYNPYAPPFNPTSQQNYPSTQPMYYPPQNTGYGYNTRPTLSNYTPEYSYPNMQIYNNGPAVALEQRMQNMSIHPRPPRPSRGGYISNATAKPFVPYSENTANQASEQYPDEHEAISHILEVYWDGENAEMSGHFPSEWSSFATSKTIQGSQVLIYKNSAAAKKALDSVSEGKGWRLRPWKPKIKT